MTATTHTTIVPARAGRAVRVARGQFVRVTDLAGQQVGDLFAFPGDQTTEHLSASHSRLTTGKLFPAIGELAGPMPTSKVRILLAVLAASSLPRLHSHLV